MNIEISKVATLQGEFRPPSDKSLTHRAYMFAALASGESTVKNPLRGEDCEATLHCLNQLGLRHEWRTPDEVRLIPCADWQQPKSALDCGNSGTTIRLLSGLIASRNLDCVLIGDASLSKRPMGRIVEPLKAMGATVDGKTPPLHVAGGSLKGIEFKSPVPSAQVKSCLLLAGLGAAGETTVWEPVMSRDHTERMLTAMGVELSYPIPNRSSVESGEYAVRVRGGQSPRPFRFSVPADISSAAFFLVAAVMLPGGMLRVRDLGINPSRTGILDVFKQCGIQMALTGVHHELGEPVADLTVRAPMQLRPFTIEASMVPRLIDEIPVLAVLATQCQGTSYIRGAKELRVKESDRIEAMATALRDMGANITTSDDGMVITGPTLLRGTSVSALGDHRIAMSMAVAGLIASGTTTIEGAESMATSYPDFENDLMRLCIV